MQQRETESKRTVSLTIIAGYYTLKVALRTLGEYGNKDGTVKKRGDSECVVCLLASRVHQEERERSRKREMRTDSRFKLEKHKRPIMKTDSSSTGPQKKIDSETAPLRCVWW